VWLKVSDADGKGMLTGRAAVEGIFAATERAVIGEGDTVFSAVAVAD
jgi:hypothetical protein